MCLQGWDKTYCLQYLDKDFDDIHFFGDKTFEVGPSEAAGCCQDLCSMSSPEHL